MPIDIHSLERDCTVLRSPIPGGEMVCRRWGSGPALLLLHGGSGSWRHWARSIHVLAARRTVYVPDIPGLGDSSLPPVECCRPRDLGALVAQALRQLLPQPDTALDIAGFSFGALISSCAALVLGPQVRSLTLVGAGALGLPRVPLQMCKWTHASSAEAVDASHRHNLETLLIADPRNVDATAVEIQRTHAVLDRLKSKRITAPDELARVLPLLAVKRICVVYGEHDAVCRPYMDTRREFFAEVLPRASFALLPAAGHWAMYENAGAFHGLLQLFLDGDGAPADAATGQRAAGSR